MVPGSQVGKTWKMNQPLPLPIAEVMLSGKFSYTEVVEIFDKTFEYVRVLYLYNVSLIV